MMNNKIEPRCSPRPRRQSAVIEALGKYPSIAKNRIATENAAPRPQAEPAVRPAANRRGAADTDYGYAWNELDIPDKHSCRSWDGR
jgi:hypothetical protein